MTNATLLRRLTEKSKLGFGKYSDLTIGEVLNLRHSNYLRWCYFNLEGISFMDEILEKVKISEEYKIDKPGKDPKLGEKLEDEIWGREKGLEGYVKRKVIHKEQKRRYMRYKKEDALHFSKSSLQRVNHGHR